MNHGQVKELLRDVRGVLYRHFKIGDGYGTLAVKWINEQPYIGVSYCTPTDQFSRPFGRGQALERLITSLMHPDSPERKLNDTIRNRVFRYCQLSEDVTDHELMLMMFDTALNTKPPNFFEPEFDDVELISRKVFRTSEKQCDGNCCKCIEQHKEQTNENDL